MPVLSCICCDKKLDLAIEDGDINQPYQGTTFVCERGHWGSTYFDGDPGKIEINICDDCLRLAEKKKQILYYSNCFPPEKPVFMRTQKLTIDPFGMSIVDEEADKKDQEEFDKLPQV